MVTANPCWAKRTAVARPMPVAAPVTRATLRGGSFMGVTQSVIACGFALLLAVSRSRNIVRTRNSKQERESRITLTVVIFLWNRLANASKHDTLFPKSSRGSGSLMPEIRVFSRIPLLDRRLAPEAQLWVGACQGWPLPRTGLKNA